MVNLTPGDRNRITPDPQTSAIWSYRGTQVDW